MDTLEPTLPNELRAFIYSCIDSVEQVDLLIRLRMARTSATVRHLSADTGLAPVTVRLHLETLVARGLLRADVGHEVGYRYAPETPDLRRYAELLDEYYSAHRDLVIRAIASRAPRTFADAFKFRKKE